jgi:hypothetical protein
MFNDAPFFLIAAIALAVPLVAKAIFHHSICKKEWAIQTGILLVVLVALYGGLKAAQTSDVRVQNGEITSKHQDRVSCSHSYQCRCRQVSTGTKGETRRECDTCYEHTHDYDWVLVTTVGDLKVPRVDRQGRHEPPRFSSATAGDPVAVTERWSNPIKGAPHSVFRGDVAEDDPMREGTPAYPSDVEDIHHLDRVFAVRGAVLEHDAATWNARLAESLKAIGREKRGNAVVVLTGDADRSYANVLERLWLRGKSNDTVVVVGVQDGKVSWAESFGWSQNPRLYVDLRNDLAGLAATPDAILPVVEKAILAHFQEMPPEDLDHLAADVTLPTWAIVLLALVTLGLSIGTTWWFHTHDTFQTQRGAGRPYRRTS